LNESFTLEFGCLPIINNITSIRNRNTTAGITAHNLRPFRALPAYMMTEQKPIVRIPEKESSVNWEFYNR
jgi:hypothetical protein